LQDGSNVPPAPGNDEHEYLGFPDGQVVTGTAEKANYWEAATDAIDDKWIIRDALKSGNSLADRARWDTLDLIVRTENAVVPKVENVEHIIIRAQGNDRATGTDNNVGDIAQIDADRFTNVWQWENKESRTDLRIEDVRLPNETGLTRDVEIIFRESNPGDVDFALYFAQKALRREGSDASGSQLYIYVANLKELDAGRPELTNVGFVTYQFHIGGEKITLDLSSLTGTISTWQEFANALKTLLAQYQPPTGSTISNAVLQQVRDLEVVVDDTANKVQSVTLASGDVYTEYVTPIRLFNSGNLPLTQGSDDVFVAYTTGSAGQQTTTSDVTSEQPKPITPYITSTITLDYVGSSSTGGDLLIGGLSTGETSTSGGVQQFDITVERDSRLQLISSTNKSLEVVTLQNRGTHKHLSDYDRDHDVARAGDLFVLGDVVADSALNKLSGTKAIRSRNDAGFASGGNQGIDGQQNLNPGFGFTDVRRIDANAYEGELTLNAVLTSDIAKKYLNPLDKAPDPAALDNVQFNYILGTNDDTFDLSISSDNLSNAGTTTREDFVLKISGGTGDDVINTLIHQKDNVNVQANGLAGTHPGTPYANGFEDWYINSKQNANLSISAGDGDDTVNTFGSGDWIVNLGLGDDTYYADNTGDKAVWVFNTSDQTRGFTYTGGLHEYNTSPARELDDLRSDVNNSYAISAGTIEVTFRQPVWLHPIAGGSQYSDSLWTTSTVTAKIPATSDGKVTDREINQAIKEAINTDPVLSKLLVAKDGPNNVLVIEALIDGRSADSLWSLDHNQGWDKSFEIDITSSVLGDAAGIQAWRTKGDYVSQLANQDGEVLRGAWSGHTADNHIEGGLGDDVIVLGTGDESNDVLVFSGYGNGNDTVVNFNETLNTREKVTTVVVTPNTQVEQFTLSFANLQLANPLNPASLSIGNGAAIQFVNSIGQPLLPGADIAFEFFKATGGDLANDELGIYTTYAQDAGGTAHTAVWAVQYNTSSKNLTFIHIEDSYGPHPSLSESLLEYAKETANVLPNITGGAAAGQFVWTGLAGTQHPESITNYQDVYSAATPGEKAHFTVDFNTATYGVPTTTSAVANGSLTFDGTTVNYATGDGPVLLAQKLAAASYTNWTARDNGDGTVTYTAKNVGEVDNWSTVVNAEVFGDVGTVTTGQKAKFTIDIDNLVGATVDGYITFFGKLIEVPSAASAALAAVAVATAIKNYWDNSGLRPVELAGWELSQTGARLVFERTVAATLPLADVVVLQNQTIAKIVDNITSGITGVPAITGDHASLTATLDIGVPSVGGITNDSVIEVFGVPVLLADGDSLATVSTKIQAALIAGGVYGSGKPLENWSFKGINSGKLEFEHEDSGIVIGAFNTAVAALNTALVYVDGVAIGLDTTNGAATAVTGGGNQQNGIAAVTETGIAAAIVDADDGENPQAASGTPPAYQVVDSDTTDIVGAGDYLDFSAYGVYAVVEGSRIISQVSSTHANATSTKYIQISGGANGVYTFTLYEGGSDGYGGSVADTLINNIVNIDFGRVIDWNDDGFVLGTTTLYTDHEGIAGNFIL
jgi:hypothetical protein